MKITDFEKRVFEIVLLLDRPCTVEEVHRELSNRYGGRFSEKRYLDIISELAWDLILVDAITIQGKKISYKQHQFYVEKAKKN